MAVSRKVLMAYMRETPGQSTRQIATKFSLVYDHLWDRLRHMEDAGHIIRTKSHVDKLTGGTKSVTVWIVNPIPPVLHRHDWSDADMQKLTRIYPHAMPGELRAAFPTRSLLAIRKKAEGMGLKRDPDVVSKARAITAKVAYFKRNGYEGDPFQTIVIKPAPQRDGHIVFEAIAQRTPLERAWSAL